MKLLGGIGCRWRYLVGLAAVLGVVLAAIGETAADTFSTIERIKASVVAVGTFQRTRAPAFQFPATGFAGGDGSLIATNVNVLPPLRDCAPREPLPLCIP